MIPHLIPPSLLWDRFESRVLEITTLALWLMRTADSLPEDERKLNQLLARYIREAIWLLRESDTGFDHAPHLDASNQPDMGDSELTMRANKRPDFQWELKDSHARTPEQYQRYYAMECKRLGTPTSPSWILNKEYVTDGIQRFATSKHSYGSPKSNSSAAMVGYVQSMNFLNILGEVNYYCRVNGTSQIGLPQIWLRDLNLLSQVVARPELFQVPLLLRHLWVDLRSIPIVPSKTKPKRRHKKSKKS